MSYKEIIEYQPVYDDGTAGPLFETESEAIGHGNETGRRFWLQKWRRYVRVRPVPVTLFVNVYCDPQGQYYFGDAYRDSATCRGERMEENFVCQRAFTVMKEDCTPY